MRADDSVVKAAAGGPLFMRRARAMFPPPGRPAAFRSEARSWRGGELKDTVTVYKNGYAVTSQFLGDLDEYRNHRYFEETAAHLQTIFGVRPVRVVSDLHPDFHTTAGLNACRRLQIPMTGPAPSRHVLAVLLEHASNRAVRPGHRLDGFGYGADGAPGRRVSPADYERCERFAVSSRSPARGDRAAKEPWRMALSYMAGSRSMAERNGFS